VTEGNLWSKLHQRLEFLLEVVTVFMMYRTCFFLSSLVPRMLIPEQNEKQMSISGDLFIMVGKRQRSP
jgi:hypothetical protein